MKTTPTETDREAARLFRPAQGMRIWRAVCADTWSDPGIVIEVDPEPPGLGGIRTERGWSWLPVCAIDSDDPATVGCMLAQVMDADSGPMGYIRPHRNNPWSTEVPEFAYSQSDTMARHFGPTRGAALVAAMKALKGAP